MGLRFAVESLRFAVSSLLATSNHLADSCPKAAACLFSIRHREQFGCRSYAY